MPTSLPWNLTEEMAKQFDGFILTPLGRSNVQLKFQRAEHEKEEVHKIEKLLLLSKFNE